MNVDSGNYVITFTSYKHSGLFDIGQSRLEGNTTVGREGATLRPVIPAVHGTFFCGLSMVQIIINILM
jgi:hypothetical protein